MRVDPNHRDTKAFVGLDMLLSEGSIEDAIAHVQKTFALKNVVYYCPTFPGRNLFKPFLITTYPEAWVDHYAARRYLAVDPAVHIAVRSGLPVDWDDLPKATRRVQQLFAESEKAGIGRHGFTVPIHGPRSGVWALFIVTRDVTDEAWRADRAALSRNIFYVAHHIHKRAMALHDEILPADLNVLSPRELEALSWAAEGKTVEDTAALMGITAETTKSHLDSAREKLHALNRVHAVAQALRAGLIG